MAEVGPGKLNDRFRVHLRAYLVLCFANRSGAAIQKNGISGSSPAILGSGLSRRAGLCELLRPQLKLVGIDIPLYEKFPTDFISLRRTLFVPIKGSPSLKKLLHRHAFCEVAWLVDVGAAGASGVISQQLQGHDVQQR